MPGVEVMNVGGNRHDVAVPGDGGDQRSETYRQRPPAMRSHTRRPAQYRDRLLGRRWTGVEHLGATRCERRRTAATTRRPSELSRHGLSALERCRGPRSANNPSGTNNHRATLPPPYSVGLGRLVPNHHSTHGPTSASELIIERALEISSERVWDAFTDPAQLTKWWWPGAFTCPSAEVDLRVAAAPTSWG